MATSHRCARSSRALKSIFSPPRTGDISVAAFLVPAFSAPQQKSNFSTSTACRSKIGAAPLSIPPGVTFTVSQAPPLQSVRGISSSQQPSVIEIQGPLGKLSYTIPPYMSIVNNEESKTRTLQILDKADRKQREMWGTARAYLQNYILGVSEGHTAILRLVGVGYRATVESKAETKQPDYEGQKFVSLKVGYSHPIELGIPRGIKASTPQPTRLLLEGMDKEVLNQFAAEIREWRRPEPYKGKGIFVNDETIRLKAKKIK